VSDLLHLRQMSQGFRRLSSTFLRTKESDGLAYMKRLYNYISQEQSIKKYIDAACEISNYDSNNFIVADGVSGQRRRLNIPENEYDHIKAMYDLLEGMLTQEPPLYLAGFCFGFDTSKSRNESIQSFLDKAFKPLIHFITDSLSKEMMALERNTPSIVQNIDKVYGTANAGNNITSINRTSQSNDLTNVLELLEAFRLEIEKCPLDKDEKEFALDDLAQIKEQIESSSPDSTRFKKARFGVGKFIESVATKVATKAIVANAPELVARGNEFLSSFGQVYPY